MRVCVGACVRGRQIPLMDEPSDQKVARAWAPHATIMDKPPQQKVLTVEVLNLASFSQDALPPQPPHLILESWAPEKRNAHNTLHPNIKSGG